MKSKTKLLPWCGSYLVYKKFIKRWLDFIMALLALIILSPLFALLAFLVFIFLGRPVIFHQARHGKDEKVFTLHKFRSMSEAYDEKGNLLPDADRLNKFGKFIRDTSLDELPELWNILRGEMSFIGPRPLPLDYMQYYNKEQRKRHGVRPGLTGLAQINGRNKISWTKKFEYDVEYTKNITFLGDVKIFLKTFIVVLRHKDIYADDENYATEDFNGKN